LSSLLSLLPSPLLLPKNISESFEAYINILEICMWLVKRSYILYLANQMLDVKKSLSLFIISNISDNMSIRSPSIISLEDISASGIANTSFIIVNNVRIISSYFIIINYFIFFIII